MKIKLLKAAAAVLALFLVGCSYNSSQTERNDRLIYAMDTVMRITVYGDESALDDAEAEIERLDALLGFDDATSDISKINSESAYASNDFSLPPKTTPYPLLSSLRTTGSLSRSRAIPRTF